MIVFWNWLAFAFNKLGWGPNSTPETPDSLEHLLRFRPSTECPVVVHLPRDLNLMDAPARGRVLDLATRFKGRIHGMVIHDHTDLARSPEQYLQSALEMESWLERVENCPWLFIEYAAGLEADTFARFFASIRALTRISACIDTGHVGIRQARVSYAKRHPGEDVCAVKSHPGQLQGAMPEVERAVAEGLPAVIRLVESAGALGKPLHFHLHDGHPLSSFSPFGVADHLSFLSEIPIGFNYQGRRAVPPMFGPDGLKQIVRKAVDSGGTAGVTFTLEIHPTFERLALGDAGSLFSHWADKTHAEEMNHWLKVLAENHGLVKKLLL